LGTGDVGEESWGDLASMAEPAGSDPADGAGVPAWQPRPDGGLGSA
jgi:hypothetical protein